MTILRLYQLFYLRGPRIDNANMMILNRFASIESFEPRGEGWYAPLAAVVRSRYWRGVAFFWLALLGLASLRATRPEAPGVSWVVTAAHLSRAPRSRDHARDRPAAPRRRRGRRRRFGPHGGPVFSFGRRRRRRRGANLV